ncbi:MAG: phosphotransferase [Alphaproteobacteria bacterium]|nr:phosphotransferase [Alphaproteobacteria bacterium]
MQTEAEVQSFLRDAGWGGANRQELVSDFSTRRFCRLTRQDILPASTILMCCESDQKTDAFVHMAVLLRRMGIAVPEIYASDLMRDLVLMQDFGDVTVGKALDKGQTRDVFDREAARVLAKIHQNFKQSMLGAFKSPLFNSALLCDQVALFLEYYYPRVFHRQASPRERSHFVEAWHSVLSPLDALPRSLLLRDFMPDNMMVLPAPLMGSSVGLLDFQDAGIGSIAYDLASWCENIRRDGGIGSMESFVATYHALNPTVDKDALLSAVHIYAAQRHTRVLGILVKIDRMPMIPLVWKTLQGLLKYNELAPVRRWFASCASPS